MDNGVIERLLAGHVPVKEQRRGEGLEVTHGENEPKRFHKSYRARRRSAIFWNRWRESDVRNEKLRRLCEDRKP